jgi:type I restriction enzyme S subunit
VERYAEHKDSRVDWIGTIPAQWELRRIKTLIRSHQVGAWGDEPQENENDRICIRVADFDFDRLTVSNDDYTIRNYTPAQIQKLTLRSGDILIEKSGGGEKMPVGRVVMFDEEFPALYANFLEAIRPIENVHSRFMGYALASAYHYGVNRKYYNQTIGIQNLNMSGYICEDITIPTHQEQTAIASYLDHRTSEIDRPLADLAHQAEMLDRYKRELIAEAVIKGLDKAVPMKNSGVEWIGEVPAHWELVPLRAYLKVVSEKNNPDLPLLSVEREKGVVDRETEGSENNHNRIPDDLTGYKVVRQGQFVMNKMKAWRGSYGVSSYDGIVSPAYYVFTLLFQNPDFFNYAIRSANYIGFFGRDSYGIRTDQWDFKIERIKDIPFAVPPADEQEAIVANLNAKIPCIETLIVDINAQIEKLKAYRQIVIHDAVTGKIKVTEG